MDVTDFVNFVDVVDSAFYVNSYKNEIDIFKMNNRNFKRKYRFSKKYVKKIVSVIQDEIKTQDNDLSIELQVLLTLQHWTVPKIHEKWTDFLGMNHSSLTRIRRNVTTTLANKATEFIQMPASKDEEVIVMKKFKNLGGLRSVIGAIGCHHVKLKKGNSSNKEDWQTLNVQIVCDADLKIRDIACLADSSSNAEFFDKTEIKMRMMASEFMGHLIGDSQYANSPYLQTPSEDSHRKRTNISHRKSTNISHTKTLAIVETCLESWKQKFHSLTKGFHTRVETTELSINALAVLHNIAIDMGEKFTDSAIFDD